MVPRENKKAENAQGGDLNLFCLLSNMDDFTNHRTGELVSTVYKRHMKVFGTGKTSPTLACNNLLAIIHKRIRSLCFSP